jgi:hypothetical protein
MQTLCYTVGNWHAEAQIEELDPGNLLAVISVTDAKGNARNGSQHTVVFEHEKGNDKELETERLIRRLLLERYGEENGKYGEGDKLQ